MYEAEIALPFNSTTLAEQANEEGGTIRTFKLWDKTTIFPQPEEVREVIETISKRLGYKYAAEELDNRVLAHVYEALNSSGYYANFFLVFQGFKICVDLILGRL
eukprot:Nk52_evm6s313 gene=Nk52_evmTU6s313